MSTEHGMHIDERQKHLRRMKKHYAQAGQKERGQLLDEMQAVTGLHIPESKDAKQIEAARRVSAATMAHARTIRFVRRWAMRITLETNGLSPAKCVNCQTRCKQGVNDAMVN